MRAALLIPLVSLLGCVGLDDTPADPAATYNGRSCSTDSDCGPDFCTSVSKCYEAATFRAVHVRWSIQNVAPSAQSCAQVGDLSLILADATGHGVVVGPLACSEGEYSMDRLPNGFVHAAIRQDSTGLRTVDYPFSTTGDVGFSLAW